MTRIDCRNVKEQYHRSSFWSLTYSMSDSHWPVIIVKPTELLWSGLVFCSLAGVSRSVTLVVAYLMTVTSLGWEEALAAVKVARPCASPNMGFQKQLQEFETSQLQKVIPPRFMTGIVWHCLHKPASHINWQWPFWITPDICDPGPQNQSYGSHFQSHHLKGTVHPKI